MFPLEDPFFFGIRKGKRIGSLYVPPGCPLLHGTRRRKKIGVFACSPLKTPSFWNKVEGMK